MASKRRNMFHKNKTQETTEEALCVVFQNGDIESNYQVGHGKDQLTCKSGQQSLASLRSYLSFVAKFLILTVILVAFIALVWHFMGLVFVIQLILVALVAYLAAGGGYRWFYVALVTVPRDLKFGVPACRGVRDGQNKPGSVSAEAVRSTYRRCEIHLVIKFLTPPLEFAA
ncbi:hypothetical protein AAG570_001573 [Ranatra chinensis]|uniref:Uncharacterized protein n=1 Tax=Ranatra chinensis TaxID=642074 RepID=A0ABD0YMY8_9HEMI